MSDDGPERRRERRLPTRIDVDVRAESTFLFANITDISSLGIFVQTEDPLPPGTRLQLRFGAPGGIAGSGEPLEVAGEVMWSAGRRPGGHPGMGIAFVDLDEPMRNRLMDLVKAIAYLG